MNKKQKLISEIRETIREGFGNESYIALHNAAVFTYDSCKYDLMGICNDEDGIYVECIGYNSFAVHYLPIGQLHTGTIKKIKNILNVVAED